jgi:hypothetical protein
MASLRDDLQGQMARDSELEEQEVWAPGRAQSCPTPRFTLDHLKHKSQL